MAAAALVTPLWWAAVSFLSTARGVDVPVLGLTLELAALVMLGLAAAAALDRWSGVPDPGVGASPLVFGSALLASRLPERWALVVPPGPAWTDAHVRWAVLLACSVLVLGWLTRDPATRARLSPRR
jgi:hypothetical protein